MADDDTKDTSNAGGSGDAGDDSKDDAAAGLKRALESERQAAKDAKRELATVRQELAAAKAASDSTKSETEKLAERVQRAEERAAEAERQALVSAVVTAKGLPPELARRLQGNTQEELEADADELLAHLKPTAGAGTFAGGTRGGGAKDQSMDQLMRGAVGR